MAISNWFDGYLLADDAGLDTSALIRDYAKELLGSSDLDNLSVEELQIVDATFHAVVWGYPVQETFRLRKLDTGLQADPNELFKPNYAANWLNKHSSPAPDASVLYVTGWLDLNEGEQVLWVPSNPGGDKYFVWAILDSYINTVGSIGPRTQQANARNDGAFYLLAGPSSEHYKSKAWSASNLGPDNDQEMPIIKIDTPYAWITARFGTDTLSETGLGVTRDFINGDKDITGTGFQLGTLSKFNNTGSIPYSKPTTSIKSGTKADSAIKEAYGRTPDLARVFFEQLGQSVLDNPVPALRTVADKVDSNIPETIVWLGNINSVQQPSPDNNDYQPPSALSHIQKAKLNKIFEPIGLDLDNGFTLPSDWSTKDHDLFQSAYSFSQKLLDKATMEDTSGLRDTNYWKMVNTNIGIYPNQWENWLVRAGVAIEGGAANIPNDAVYPTTQKDSDGNTLTSTYNYTITLPNLNSGSGPTRYGPADGFWSYTIYQPNPGSAYQPFLVENSINNRFYSPVNTSATLTTDGWLSAVKPGNWNNATALGTALYTGTSSTIDGLKASTTYYVSDIQESNDSTLLFKVSDRYDPDLNLIGRNGTAGVPIGGAGSPGASLQLSGVGNSQTFGWINPVSQLGSAQLGSLQANNNNEIVLHLRANGPNSGLSNWLPTPNSGRNSAAYNFEVMARFYEPTTGDPSILASTGRPITDSLYIPPGIERTSLSRIALWEDLDQAGQDLLLARTGSSSVDLSAIQDPFDADAIGALLDLRWADGAMEGTTWKLNYSYERLAFYTNSLYFYTVDTVTGMINGKSPGDFGYTDMAMSRRINPNDPIMNYKSGSTVSGSLNLSGGSIYMPLVITEPGQILIPNSRHTLGSTHFKLEGDRGFVFEDRKYLGDHDYNDGMFTVTDLTPLG